MKIKNVEMKENIIKEIGKFTILWSDFEKSYCHNDCSSNAIWEYSNSNSIDVGVLKEFSHKVQGRAYYFDREHSIYIDYNLIPNGARRPSASDIKTIKDFVEFKGENLLAGALLAIYRIRNNLLHGLKELSELEDQLDLFKSINKVLENIQ